MKRPRLRPDLAIVEQVYRGETSYVVKDRSAQKYFRFKPLEVFVMQQLDGERTASEVAASLAEQGLPFKASAVEAFARKLDGMGLLEKSVAEKSVLLMERLRAERTRRVKGTHYRGSILRMRWPLGDPDGALTRWMPRVGFFFSRPFLALSAALFLVYAVLLVARWPQLAGEMQRLYSPSQYTLGFVVTFWLTALVIVAIHELGHAFTCKRFGGEVREMGFMLVYFQPAFYCNVNDAWTFPEKRARLWVTLAGSWVQMVVAALAAITWWLAEPDTLLSEVAFVAVLFAGVATVVANANPLLPLDGYYALSDWLEVPNLRKRAFGWVSWWLKRHLLRLAVPEPEASERERRILALYGVLAIAYSTSLLTLIALRLFGWVSRELGLLATLAFLLLVWRSLSKRMRGLGQSFVTAVREHRTLAGSPGARWAGLGLVALLALLFLAPWPLVVKGRFVARAGAELVLAAPEEAVVARVDAWEGATLEAGAPVMALRRPQLELEALRLGRERDSLASRAAALLAAASAGEARAAQERARAAHAAWQAARSRLAALTLRSPVRAVVATPRLRELVGRRLLRGEQAALLLAHPDSVELVITLTRSGGALVRSGQPAALAPYSGVGQARRERVWTVSATGRGGGDSARVEARIVVASDRVYRPGVSGEARIRVGRSSVAGALWWALRSRLRNDLFL